MPVRLLVSNDDGYRAEGIAQLRRSLQTLPDVEVTVIAPDRNRSGASNSLTLDVPLRVVAVEPGVHFVAGTPTDCVHLAVSGALRTEFDMVVAGINDGANLGDDVLYSGTVAAAIEGRFLGLTALAFSLCSRPGGGHFDSAARVAQRLVGALLARHLPAPLILNVNVPDLPYEQIRGIRCTRLGARHRSEPVVRARDPRGHEVLWIGPAGPGADTGAETDFEAIEQGWVSVTPLSTDLTQHRQRPALTDWLASA